MSDFFNHLPMITFMLIGFAVGTLQWRKARRCHGLKRTLARAVSALTYFPALTILGVLIYGDYTLGWPGPIIVLSILLSIAVWTASLIWAGPADAEDKRVFLVTVGMMALMILSVLAALAFGLVD